MRKVAREIYESGFTSLPVRAVKPETKCRVGSSPPVEQDPPPLTASAALLRDSQTEFLAGALHLTIAGENQVASSDKC